MKIILNGKNIEIPEKQNLKQLLEKRKELPRFYAVAVNGKIVPKQELEKYSLKAGDKVEIVSVFQGG